MAESMLGTEAVPSVYRSHHSKHRSGSDRYGLGAEEQKQGRNHFRGFT